MLCWSIYVISLWSSLTSPGWTGWTFSYCFQCRPHICRTKTTYTQFNKKLKCTYLAFSKSLIQSFTSVATRQSPHSTGHGSLPHKNVVVNPPNQTKLNLTDQPYLWAPDTPWGQSCRLSASEVAALWRKIILFLSETEINAKTTGCTQYFISGTCE